MSVHVVCPGGRVCVHHLCSSDLGEFPRLWEIFSDRLLESTELCVSCFYSSWGSDICLLFVQLLVGHLVLNPELILLPSLCPSLPFFFFDIKVEIHSSFKVKVETAFLSILSAWSPTWMTEHPILGLLLVLVLVSLFAEHEGSRLTCLHQAQGKLASWNSIIESSFTFAKLVFVSEQRRPVKKLLV